MNPNGVTEKSVGPIKSSEKSIFSEDFLFSLGGSSDNRGEAEMPANQLIYGTLILASHTSEPPNETIACVMY